jgi:Ca2+-binding RTX toxin-like protein
MQDDVYVLDLLVTGAEYVSVIDDGSGIDTIVVSRLYSQTVDIDLAWTIIDGSPYSATSRYVSALQTDHRLVIFGQIENATGSNGSDNIAGNDLANTLHGDRRPSGLGAADALRGCGGNDSLYGGAGNDLVTGGRDDDALWGDAGNDSLSGGPGSDTLTGGRGADTLDGGGDAGDILSYATSRRPINLSLQADAATLGQGGDAAGDWISGFLQVVGSARGDRIAFLDKSTLPFGQGDNTVYGGAGRDRIALGGGDDVGHGGIGDDVLFGELGRDTLFGDAGRDQLYGGLDQDVLTGGAGADRFIFVIAAVSRPDATDAITDFSSAEGDRIDLGPIDANEGLADNQAFDLILGDFTGQAGEVRVEVQGSNLVVYADTNGDAQADFAVKVLNCDALILTDFLL